MNKSIKCAKFSENVKRADASGAPMKMGQDGINGRR